MTVQTARQPKGVPVGGQFAATAHAEPDTVLAPAISVPSSPALFGLVYEDRLSNAERRGYSREALEQSLEGDFFEVVHDAEDRKAILDEADRDDSVDKAIDRIEDSGIQAHHFGAALARELKDIRQARLAVESHYVPTASETFEAVAAHIAGPAENYDKALRETFPHIPEQWFSQMMQNHALQPESWQRRELYKIAVANERVAAGTVARPEVSAEENPHFTSHPVSALESRIDALIVAGGDPSAENNIRYLANEEGEGYGTVNIKAFARLRLGARRPAAG